MQTILENIVSAKRAEVEHQRSEVPLNILEERIAVQPRPFNFSGALLGDRVRLIAEVKKASPSRGLLRDDFDPAQLQGHPIHAIPRLSLKQRRGRFVPPLHIDIHAIRPVFRNVTLLCGILLSALISPAQFWP